MAAGGGNRAAGVEASGTEGVARGRHLSVMCMCQVQLGAAVRMLEYMLDKVLPCGTQGHVRHPESTEPERAAEPVRRMRWRGQVRDLSLLTVVVLLCETGARHTLCDSEAQEEE
jgi:hypothetical protein